ncbi:pilus assembly protein PilP [Uruburuella testudinis]|uniref:Pilus assembly protein PilP n=1 Tax=Uruburuella testudinis TaxID=1282863 RepID=A0ABY4DUI6_9NEIS|nr:pilus assembly protein PilP [Uruburuella testudinis]UOO82697.1 pilus assembly protein PilP [Uruburuella testudinis]
MKYTILLAGLLALNACTPAHEDLREWMNNTRTQAKAHALSFEPPAIHPAQTYMPPNYSGLNAFDSKRLNVGQQGANAPNMSRPKEILEGFSLENLKYVGTLKSGNRISGYIEADGHVYTVRAGNYIGQNFGQIQSITDDKIVLTEVVEDTYGNWVFRNAELPLSSGAADTANTQN